MEHVPGLTRRSIRELKLSVGLACSITHCWITWLTVGKQDTINPVWHSSCVHAAPSTMLPLRANTSEVSGDRTECVGGGRGRGKALYKYWKWLLSADAQRGDERIGATHGSDTNLNWRIVYNLITPARLANKPNRASETAKKI